MSNKVLTVGCDLNGRTITNAIPDTTDITTEKIIAKVSDDNYIAENLMEVEGQTGNCSVCYYHYLDENDDEVTQIFYCKNGSTIVTNIASITLPDNFGVISEIDDTAVCYEYITRGCHEKFYVICEDFCKEESLTKSQITNQIEDQVEDEVKNYCVPQNSVIGYDGDTIPNGYDEIPNAGLNIVSPAEPTGANRQKLWLQKGKNKCNSKIELGDINSTTGISESNSNCVRTQSYIKVEANIQYTLSNDLNYSQIVFQYDANYNLLQADTQTTFVTVNNVQYIKWRTSSSNTENNINVKFQLEQGSTATTYEPYVEEKMWVLNDNNVYVPFKEDNMSILWINPNPTNNFAAQDIVLNSSDYDYIECLYYNHCTNNKHFQSSGKIPRGYNIDINGNFIQYNNPISIRIFERLLTYVNATKYTANLANYTANLTTTQTSEGFAVPMYFLGYKN